MIEVLKQALEALQFALHVGFDESSGGQIKKGEKAYQQHKAAIPSLRQAIKELERQEPVAWMVWGENNVPSLTFTKPADKYVFDALYTHPPQRPRVVFPTMLRKMWSGGEVQAWLDENVNKEKHS